MLKPMIFKQTYRDHSETINGTKVLGRSTVTHGALQSAPCLHGILLVFSVPLIVLSKLGYSAKLDAKVDGDT